MTTRIKIRKYEQYWDVEIVVDNNTIDLGFHDVTELTKLRDGIQDILEELNSRLD